MRLQNDIIYDIDNQMNFKLKKFSSKMILKRKII